MLLIHQNTPFWRKIGFLEDRMSKRLTTAIAAVIILLAVTPASAMYYTMDFTNATYDIGSITQIDLTNQYAAFGLTFHKVYRYIDSRDPWDDFGISNGFLAQNGWEATLGTVFFSQLTDSVGFDWWTIDDNEFTVQAFASNGALLGGFSGLGSGSDMIVADDISYLEFHNGGGFVQISNLSYDRSVIPEPGTVALFGLGMLGAGIIRRVRRK
jgi:hypothetical protein